MPSLRAVVGLMSCALLAPVGFAAAQTFPRPETPVFVVIFDLRAGEPGEVNAVEDTGPVSFPESEISATAVDCTKLESRQAAVTVKELRGFIECAIGARLSGTTALPEPSVGARAAAARLVAASLSALRKEQSTRAISSKGSEVIAVALQVATARTITKICTRADGVERDPMTIIEGRTPRFTIKETERKTRIESDFDAFLTLAGRVAAPGAAAPAPPRPCQTTSYESTAAPVLWLSAKPVPLSLTRATVALDAVLPAALPAMLWAADPELAKARLKDANINLATAAREKAEAEDLKLREAGACPPAGEARFNPLAYPACGLRPGATAEEQVAAVAALSKMTTPRRASLLRWAVVNAPAARAAALVALAQIDTSPAGAAPEKGAEVKQSASFTSGPLEHWSLSADVFTSRKTPFKKDDNGAVTLDGTPPIFYVSLNFLLGDVQSETRRPWQNVELKFLIKGTKQPLDSIGFGIGLRGQYGKRFGLDFDLLSPFYAVTWSAPEKDGDPRVVEHRFGVSLNINKALDWVK